jgi:tetratricopeptide (TPR) repeat protein
MIRLAFCGFVFVLSAVAQSTATPRPGGSIPSPVGNTPTLGNTNTSRPSTQPSTNTGMDPTMNRTVFISGKVVLEDGTPPPEAVIIERSCGPTRRAETRTDNKGHFSFEVGGAASNTEQIMDASNSGMNSGRSPMGMGSTGATGNANTIGGRMNDPASLRGCELKAVLPGYQSNAVNLMQHTGLDNPDIGIIILKRLGGREGDTISMTNALAPKDAKKAYDKSRQLVAKGNANEAQKELSKAVGIYPKYASAWSELGRLQMEANDAPAARESFQKALDADPKYLPPYERLAVLALRERKWADVLSITDRLIKLNAYDYPQAYYYNAMANLNLNHPEAAEKSARAALKQDPLKFSRAGYILGLALAQKGEFAPAAEQLKAYLATGPAPGEIEPLKKQLADIEKLATQQTASRENQ